MYHPVGCLCSQFAKVHVCRSLRRFDRAEVEEWSRKHISAPRAFYEPCQLPKAAILSAPPGLTRVGIVVPPSAPPKLAADTSSKLKAVGPPPAKPPPAPPTSDQLSAWLAAERASAQAEMKARAHRLLGEDAVEEEAEAACARQEADVLHADVAGVLARSFKVHAGSRVLSLASHAMGRLCLVDLTECIVEGHLVDIGGSKLAGGSLVVNFAGKARAFQHEPDPEESNMLKTLGGESLVIHFPQTDEYILNGQWVGAKLSLSEDSLLWYPLRCCRLP